MGTSGLCFGCAKDEILVAVLSVPSPERVALCVAAVSVGARPTRGPVALASSERAFREICRPSSDDVEQSRVPRGYRPWPSAHGFWLTLRRFSPLQDLPVLFRTGITCGVQRTAERKCPECRAVLIHPKASVRCATPNSCKHPRRARRPTWTSSYEATETDIPS